eukprot:254091_1
MASTKHTLTDPNSQNDTDTNSNTTDNITFQFIKDDFCQLCEPIQKKEFLYTGKIPAAGMRTETQVNVSDAGWARFSGVITSINDPPTKKELSQISEPFTCPCNDENCALKDGVKAAFGAEHGQRVTGRCILNFDFYNKMENMVSKDKVYEIIYQMDSNKNYVWNVVEACSLDNVSANEFRDLIWPQNGHECNECEL